MMVSWGNKNGKNMRTLRKLLTVETRFLMKKIYPAKSDEVQFVMTKNALFSNNYLEEQA
jgi:hypothetical protein